MRDWRLGLLAIGFLGLLNSWVNGQVPGSLDASFGVDGAVTIDLGPDETCARLLTDAEGNFYFLGNISRYDSVADLDFLVGKCKPDGKLDIGFGDGGQLSGDFGGFRNSRILDADLRDGAIYLIGEGGNGSLDTQQVFIGKLGLNGQWDADFGLNGFFSRKFVGEWAAAGAIKALEDGRIAYCGMTTDTNAWHIELPMAGRLLANGLADSSFGNTGCITW
ncbi:MAG TPA: hypothetical protein VHS96_05375, partial [Bacteroidia bacterium]|nr:hypothetical protein [Bacteroidia bacterium]